MEWLTSLLLVLDIICALGVIVLVLLQHGKGADMGAAFGSGASGSLFGATGGANFLSRLTAGFATGFFVLTLALALMGNKKPGASKSIMDTAPATKSGDGIPGQSGAAPKVDAPKADGPKVEPPKSEAPKSDAPKTDAPKSDAPKAPAGDIPK
jgi:preprotein translocase subunit SecG